MENHQCQTENPSAEQELFTPEIMNKIRRYARRCLKKGLAEHFDLEDLVQTFFLDIWSRRSKWDPDLLPWNAYVDSLMKHESSRILKRLKKPKRDACPISLSKFPDDDAINSLRGNQITGKEGDVVVWLNHGGDREQDLSIALDQVIATLHPREQIFLQQYRSLSKSQLAKHYSRKRMKRRLRIIRQHFKNTAYTTF